MTISRNLFAPSGPLALAASAYASPFEAVAQPAPETLAQHEVAVISITGPLVLRWTPDSPPECMAYEYVRAVARYLFASPSVKAVVMRVDSPGGVVSGAFETAQLLRELSASTGKPLYAYVEGMCCSAAYALASAANQIFASSSSPIGSIGVIHPLGDSSKKFERDGLRFVLVTSGERKADGNPLAAISDDAIAATQTHVDELAEVFFATVSAMRPALTVDALRGMQAAQFIGKKAASLRLIDDVSTLDRVLALAANADISQGKPMKLKAAAQAIVDDKDASDEDKKEAKAYLASLESDDDKGDDDKASADDGDDDKGDDDKASASADDDKGDDKKKDDKATAGASASAVSLEPRLRRVETAFAKAEERAQRSKIFKSRPDLTAEQRTALAAVPVAALASALAAIPVTAPAKSQTSPMAGALAAVKGGEQPSAAAASAPVMSPERAAQRARMGLGSSHCTAFRKDGDTLILDMLTPVAATVAATESAGSK